MGKYIYGEWLRPIYHYLSTLKSNEICYEIIIPIIIAIITSFIYYEFDFVILALLKLRDLLPSSLSILIGFTIMCITILVTSDSKSLAIIRKKNCDNRLIGHKEITVFRWLLILFSHSLLMELITLFLVFFSAFVIPLISSLVVGIILLFCETFLLSHILFLMIRSMTNLYLLFRIESDPPE